MSIDEAIAHEREVSEIHRNDIVPKEDYHNMPWIDKENELNMRSAEEHKQIAEWLEELKDYRKRECNHINEALYDKGYSDGYNKAIEYFVILFKSKTSIENSLVGEIAEQLKDGGEND